MTAWEGLVAAAPGVRLRVRIDDAPAGAPALLLVNGLMMTIDAWDAFAERFRSDHRVVRYDQRGQGGSDDPDGPHRIEAHASDLVALLKALTREHDLGAFHLLGLSSGVPTAILAAAEIEAETPGRLRSLIACDGFVATDAHLRAVIRAWLGAHRAGGSAHRFDVATPWVWGAAFLRDREGALADWRAAAAATDPRRAHALIAGMAAFDGDVGPALATLRAPVLALHGADDLMTPARHGRALARHAANGRFVSVPDAGHAAPIERPEAVAAALRAFWREALPPEGEPMTYADVPPHHVQVDGRHLAYHRAGEGHAVVLIHGNFASKRWFSDLLADPPDGATLYALDLPNFGDSDPLGEPITIAAYAEAVRGFVAALDLERPILVGHSLGGAVAMAAAAADPTAWAALALVDGSAPDGLVTPEEHYPLLQAFFGNAPLLERALAPMLPSRRPADFDALVADALRMHPDAFQGNARALATLDLAPRLAAYGGHVLVLRGGLDALITEAMAERTAAAFTGAAHVDLETWDDVGHSPATEAPQRFAARLRALILAATP